MNSKNFSEAMSKVGDKYIDEAITYHKVPQKRTFSLVACLVILFLLCSFGYASYIYWGIGSAENIDFNDLTQPFGTFGSDQESSSQEKEVFYNKSDIINDYTDVYAENSICIALSGNSIPSIYFSPNYMAIFTQEDEGGWMLSKGEELSIDFTLYDEQTLELEIGYIFNGEYHNLFSAMGPNFSDTIYAPENGIYYFCVTNASSSNAVIKQGNITKAGG